MGLLIIYLLITALFALGGAVLFWWARREGVYDPIEYVFSMLLLSLALGVLWPVLVPAVIVGLAINGWKI